jgi:hypothetical protein
LEKILNPLKKNTPAPRPILLLKKFLLEIFSDILNLLENLIFPA